jgi:hypothetical protein
MTMNEKVTVTVPGVGSHVLDIEVRPDEGDDEIARRLAQTFPIGTILGVSGAKWKVVSKDPPVVVELGLPREDGPQPGERYRPKDPRRKSGFTIKAVTETSVIADDGRVVSLDRMKRYEKIG